MILASLGVAAMALCLGGCGPSYRQLRVEGQQAMLKKDFGPARYILLEAEKIKRNDPENLHDLGLCSAMIAKQRLEQHNYPAGMRELDNAVEFYSRAIDAHPGHHASTVPPSF